MLRLEGVTKRFGGLVATDAVTFSVDSGEIHALIGPNGAGKTTLINQISGALPADEGRIDFLERDVTALKTHARVAAGLVRSYQITSIFRTFSVLDNAALAVQARSGSSFSFWRPVAAETALFDEARSILGEVGLSEKADSTAAHLSHGEQRALEVGLALATSPKLVLLDEPMAGMGPEESSRLVATLKALKGEITMLLVEHDMDAVFALADRITVLVYGRAIASGAPDRIRNDPEVIKAYLGEPSHA